LELAQKAAIDKRHRVVHRQKREMALHLDLCMYHCRVKRIGKQLAVMINCCLSGMCNRGGLGRTALPGAHSHCAALPSGFRLLSSIFVFSVFFAAILLMP
jgi:hypothetical protein